MPRDRSTEPPVERSRALAIGVGIGLVVIALSWGIFDGPFWGGGFFLSPGAVRARAGRGWRSWSPGAPAAARAAARRPLATILLAFAALRSCLGIAALAAGWAAATGHGVAVAAVVIGIGVLLVVAAFNGGARWLIAPALALAVPLGVVSAADISFGDGIGERDYRPLTVAAVPRTATSSGSAAGRRPARPRLERVRRRSTVDVDLGVGQAIVARAPRTSA